MKIISFYYAGGNKYSFQNISGNNSDFIVMEYPGRGTRASQELIVNIEMLAEDLFQKVKNEISSADKYLLYGHSMGALLGYLICRKIERAGLKKPQKLIVSGKKAPSTDRQKKIAHLPDQEFWQEIIKLGGTPDDLLKHTELIRHYTPILKADFTAIENYQYAGNGKLTIPIDVFYGSEEATKEEMNDWEKETTGDVNITQMKGNHFFIFEHVEFFSNYFKSI